MHFDLKKLSNGNVRNMDVESTHPKRLHGKINTPFETCEFALDFVPVCRVVDRALYLS